MMVPDDEVGTTSASTEAPAVQDTAPASTEAPAVQDAAPASTEAPAVQDTAAQEPPAAGNDEHPAHSVLSEIEELAIYWGGSLGARLRNLVGKARGLL